MYVRPISARLFAGRSTPEMRAIIPPCLTLPLLVLRVGADHPHHASAVDNLAIVTHFFYRRPDLHLILPSPEAVALSLRCRRWQTVILTFVIENRQPLRLLNLHCLRPVVQHRQNLRSVSSNCDRVLEMRGRL